ncbi:M20 family metallo-hydrolase [Bacteroidales bacterium OttesenSCG-928-A17]|nr:M20 family metallo-hydrolase [Bacteroidales bacterium OttesenSCG-928-A17]
MNIDSLYYEAIDLLKQLISIPSVSREESGVADALEVYLKESGLLPLRKENNVWILSSEWDSSKPTILLNSHLDTVKPVSAWTKDPFSPLEEDGKIYGLGSNDAGASLVSLLMAFRILTANVQSYNLIFLASAEEEISGKNGLELALSELPSIDVAIVGEPTLLQAAIAEKGLMVLDAVVRGKSGHAARDEGENAIYKALPVIEWFRDKRFSKESSSLGSVKMSLTVIQGGTQHNVVPDECRMVIDVRSNELYSNQELFEQIAAECGCEVQARSFRLNSSSISETHPLVRRAVILGAKTFGSPTLSDQSLMHFPSLKIGPGDSARSHSADEFIFCSEIREAIHFYVHLLDGLTL